MGSRARWTGILVDALRGMPCVPRDPRSEAADATWTADAWFLPARLVERNQGCVLAFVHAAEHAEKFVRLAVIEWQGATQADRPQIARTLIGDLAFVDAHFEALEPGVVARHLDDYWERRANGPRGGKYKIRVLAQRLTRECHAHGLAAARDHALDGRVAPLERLMEDSVRWSEQSGRTLRREALLRKRILGE